MYRTGRKLEDIVRSENAVPATISLMDGRIYVGLSDEQLLQLSRPEPKQHDQRRMKCSVRDLPACLRQRKIGGTTVAVSTKTKK
jgi:pseudouridine-5'-phosphate glycosidase